MKVLVTGGAGFIGSHIVDHLISENYEVIVIDNESSDSSIFYWNNKSNNYKLDILDYDSTRKLYEGVDVVFHLAAESRIQPCIENPLKALLVNVSGTSTVLQCAREAGVKRVIYSSTSAAYGLSDNYPSVETMKPDCLNPYSISKVAGEELCKMYSKLYNLETVIFRYFNVYGERQPTKGQYALVLGIFLRQYRSGEPLTIVGDGEQRRDFIHVSDVVKANILAATTHKLDFGGIYNVGSGKNYSVNEISSMISNKTINLEPRSGEVKITLANIEKIKSQLNWLPTIQLETWINKVKDLDYETTNCSMHDC